MDAEKLIEQALRDLAACLDGDDAQVCLDAADAVERLTAALHRARMHLVVKPYTKQIVAEIDAALAAVAEPEPDRGR